MRGFSINQPFFTVLEAALERADEKTETACRKEVGKLEAFAGSLRIKPEELRVLDVCTADADITLKLQRFIDGLPSDRDNYRKEIAANVRRAIGVVTHEIVGPAAQEGKIWLVPRPKEPVLTEIYDALPVIRCSKEGPARRNGVITENSTLLFLACEEVLTRQKVDSAAELLSKYRSILYPIIDRNVPPGQYSRVKSDLRRVLKKTFGVRPKPARRLPLLEEFPLPLREEVKIYLNVADGKLLDGVLTEAEGRGIKLKGKLSPAVTSHLVKLIGGLVMRHPERKKLSVADILRTTEREEVGADGRTKTVFYNEFLTPLREEYRARETAAKGADFDSHTFRNLLDLFKAVAAYNKIFDHHGIIYKAFKLKFDNRKLERRKAEKKMELDRHVLGQWIEDEFPRFETVVKRGLFKRDAGERGAKDANDAMAFVCLYVWLTTTYVMGFRQRQLRDCVEGVNIKVSATSVEFSYTAEQMKRGQSHYFRADMTTADRTHGNLIQTLYLYKRHVLPYMRLRLAPWQTGNAEKDKGGDPRNQFFLHKSLGGTFACFDKYNNENFTAHFKRVAQNHLKSPNLRREAIKLMHPHFMRGVAMDVQVTDNGMSEPDACNYFSMTTPIFRKKYRNKSTPTDASRAVVVLNMQMKELEEAAHGTAAAAQIAQITQSFNGALQSMREALGRAEERERQTQEEKKALQSQLDSVLLKLASIEQRVAHHGQLQETAAGRGNSGIM